MKTLIPAALLCGVALFALAAAPADTDGWISMFDGKTLNGWKANERPESLDGSRRRHHGRRRSQPPVLDGARVRELRVQGGPEDRSPRQLRMYFRTAFGPGFPKGYEAQVNSSHTDPVRTGSLYNFVKVLDTLIPDDTWGTQHIIADGNHIIIKVNDKVTVDYIEATNRYTKGYLALQQHNKGSVVQYRNLMFRPLPAKK